MIASRELINLPDSLPPEPLDSDKQRYVQGMQDAGLLLMQHGAALNEELSDTAGYYKTIVEQYVEWLRQQVATRDTTLSAHCSSARSAALPVSSDQCCATAAAAVAEPAVRVQLVHAETGERGSHVYTLDTAALAQLHAARGEAGVSVLSTLVAPLQGWRAADSDTTAVRLLPYDGELSHVYCTR
jgi:hypothetical protein